MKHTVKKISKTIFGTVESDYFYQPVVNISTTKGGLIICLHCYSKEGIKARNYYDKKRGFMKLSKTCIKCKTNEKTNNYTGEILSQTVNMFFVDKYKNNNIKYIIN